MPFLVRPLKDILESFIQPMTCEQIKACMDKPDEDLSLVDPWSFVCVLLCCFTLLNYGADLDYMILNILRISSSILYIKETTPFNTLLGWNFLSKNTLILNTSNTCNK